MNLLAQLLALTTLIFLLTQGVAFHRATICRSRAWEKSFVLYSRSLFPAASPKETSFDPGCKLFIQRREQYVSWQRGIKPSRRTFQLSVEGKL